MQVIDHTNEQWNLRYTRHGRENGAATYSRELVKYHIPIWKKLAADTIVVSTTPLITSRSDYGIDEAATMLVQYLHRYPYEDPTVDVKRVVKAMGDTPVLFVVAYQNYAAVLKSLGYKVLYLPMTIDSRAVRKYATNKKAQGKKTFAYFGNLLHGKQQIYTQIKHELISRGYSVDTFADNKYNNSPITLTQQEIWERLSEYEYGIGVGRCALEMYALGLKVLVIGGQYGGIVTNRTEFASQLATNFNGRVITFDRELQSCLAVIDQSATFTSDIHETLPLIENEIAKALL